MKNINTSQDVYAFNFGEALKIIINNLMNSDFERNKNLGAPFSFNENNISFLLIFIGLIFTY